ncbi:right-handed parallel beta-helix repeat-containing protein [Nocardioides sp. KR10-350]|uniref:right-handed parallel beta-helix repeat-containing protein n=1 Tax=Nocardioides cheoyonin TaxID=3156615 RepID=UPI0032B3B5CC
MRPADAVRRARAAATAAAVGALAVALAGCGADADSAPGTPSPGAPVSTGAATTAGSGGGGGAPAYGAGKPAKVCGSALTRGPATAPAGAVVVGTGQRLDEVVDAHPAGTTYYLTGGRHTLAAGAYRQVQPKDGDVFVGAPGAVLDGRQDNLYAFGGQASGVTIRTLTVQGFGGKLDNRDEGVVNHDTAPGWRLEGVTLRRNGGAGVMLGSHSVVRDSCLVRNGQYGFSAYAPGGVRDVTLVHNEIAFNDTADWERRIEGCGCTGGGKFWATAGAVVRDNYVHDNRGAGLWADTNDTGFLVTGNTITDNAGSGMMYETSYNARITRNTFARNALVAGPGASFPQPALYLSESGADPRAGRRFGSELLVSGNLFEDNWSGVILWENADRFAGSPANTSSGATTLVNPKVATEAACSTPATVKTKPYVDDCRWKTQHVRVTGNRFVLHRAKIEGCTTRSLCGINGVFSQWGTYPAWSPFKGDIVEDAITFKQGNRFTRNAYVGPWRFMAHELGQQVSWAQWRAAPYGQDSGSSLKR